MLLVVISLVACVPSVWSQQLSVRCSEGNASAVSVRAAGGEAARYVVEYCAPAAGWPRVTRWELALRFLDEPPARCHRDALSKLRRGRLHSISTEDIAPMDLNCSHVCFSKPMDLMFRRCYQLSNRLQRGNIRSQPFDSYYYADNDISGPEYYYNTSNLVKDFSHDTMVSFYWYPGHIPVTDYEVQLCKDNVTHEERECLDVKPNCTLSGPARQLHCVLFVPHACYSMLLTHAAPWASSNHFQDLQHVTGHFCHSEDEPLAAGAGAGAGVPAAVYWAGGLAALGAACALAALAAWHSRLLRKLPRLQQRVLDYWLASRQAGAGAEVKAGAGPAAGADGQGIRILLLYARDCAAAQRTVAALTDLLQLVAPNQVYDIFSAEVTAQCGRAPHAWVRAARADARVRIVLLQTPALQALHATSLARGQDDDMQLEEPLLPRCVVYRAPQFGDTLLQYALRLMAETAHAQPLDQPYHKYYIATLSDLPAETFPAVVPFRRYELPAAAGVLLRDLSPGPAPPPAPPPAALAELQLAAGELAQYVRDNGNYLTDELLFL